MVEKYARVADEVIVLISRPTKSGRTLPNGREVTAEDSEAIWKILAAELDNVDIKISTHASPVNAAYEYVGAEGPINIGDTVILGASKKDDDWKRWTGAEKYVKEGVNLISPEQSAVTPTERANGKPYSATDFRNALGGGIENEQEIAEFVGEENVDNVLSILELDGRVEEMSAMAGGGVAISSGPLGSGSGRPKKRRTRRNENIAIANEVLKLIKERGILR